MPCLASQRVDQWANLSIERGLHPAPEVEKKRDVNHMFFGFPLWNAIHHCILYYFILFYFNYKIWDFISTAYDTKWRQWWPTWCQTRETHLPHTLCTIPPQEDANPPQLNVYVFWWFFFFFFSLSQWHQCIYKWIDFLIVLFISCGSLYFLYKFILIPGR